MPTVQAVADAHVARQQRLARATARRLALLWQRVDGNRIALTWKTLLVDAVAELARGQTQAAADGADYIEQALDAQDVAATAAGAVSPSMLAGIASDGRALTSLLYQPAISTLVAIRQGASVRRAKAVGLNTLDMIARTQVADAGRSAETIGMTIRPQVTGYVRMLSLPSCSRCIVLGGKWFRWNEGFQRHPVCDCRHVPARENVAGDLTTDPKKLFNRLSEEQQNKIFGEAGAEAIRNGADINQVVNARRGMDTAVVFGRPVQHTREGITKRGHAGRRLKGPVRLMPETILREAKGNRSEAIRLLKAHGYFR